MAAVNLSQFAINAPIATTAAPIPVEMSAILNAFSAPVDVPTIAVYAACSPVATFVCRFAAFSATTLFNIFA